MYVGLSPYVGLGIPPPLGAGAGGSLPARRGLPLLSHFTQVAFGAASGTGEVLQVPPRPIQVQNLIAAPRRPPVVSSGTGRSRAQSQVSTQHLNGGSMGWAGL